MKNIHVLPTDKPSKLYVRNDVTPPFYSNFQGKPVNIYITSDEEIKEGDWFINESNQIEKGIEYYNYKVLSPECKKIILTTDTDLIKDGVQSIDDEFLEWFVKNPGCESVDVEHTYISRELNKPTSKYYKIILPKEEPKQDQIQENHYDRNSLSYSVIREEETLEESNQTTAIRFLEWYRRRGIIYQFHSYHIPMDDRKYLNSLQLFEIFKKELYE